MTDRGSARPVGAADAFIVAMAAAAPWASRLVAAVAGGYAVAALASVAVLALPLARSESVMLGQLLGLVAYAIAVVWVYAARSACRAWRGLAIAGLLLAAAAWPVWREIAR